MSSIQVRFFSPIDKNGPVESANPVAVETIVTTASNQVTTATSGTCQSVALTAWGGAIKASIGSNPNATTDTTFFIIPDGSTLYLSGLRANSKVAAVDA